MSRRTRACLTCDGRTRHNDRRCARCRRIRWRQGPARLWMLPKLDDQHAPTLVEMAGAIDLTCYLQEIP